MENSHHIVAICA